MIDIASGGWRQSSSGGNISHSILIPNVLSLLYYNDSAPSGWGWGIWLPSQNPDIFRFPLWAPRSLGTDGPASRLTRGVNEGTGKPRFQGAAAVSTPRFSFDVAASRAEYPGAPVGPEERPTPPGGEGKQGQMFAGRWAVALHRVNCDRPRTGV